MNFPVKISELGDIFGAKKAPWRHFWSQYHPQGGRDWTAVSLETYLELKKHLGDIFGGNIIHSVVETAPREISTVAWRHTWS